MLLALGCEIPETQFVSNVWSMIFFGKEIDHVGSLNQLLAQIVTYDIDHDSAAPLSLVE
jgi:hypothetical protein